MRKRNIIATLVAFTLAGIALSGIVQAPSSSAEGTRWERTAVTPSAGPHRVSVNTVCNGKPITVWADFERSGNVRRGVRGGFSRDDYTLTFGRLGVVSYGAGRVTDVRFSQPVKAGSGYSTGAVADKSVAYVQVVPWPWGATTIGQACNGGLGYALYDN